MGTALTTETPIPKTVYLTLWFPLLSETFVFFEVEGLWKRGMPLSVYSLYGRRRKFLAEHMRNSKVPVRHLGIPYILPIAAAVIGRLILEPRLVGGILRKILFAKWRDMEMRLENYWAFCCGIYLAGKLRKAGVRHVHGAWASGPATACWVIYQLEGISYSFTARATDVRPPDGFLKEKLAECAFARADSSFNVPHMRSFLPADKADKVHLVYNSLTMKGEETAPVHMQAPCRLIGIGRLIEKKGFSYLIRAAAQLQKENVPVDVTIVGGGTLMHTLQNEAQTCGVAVNFTGALPHDQIAARLCASDILVMPSVIPDGTEQSDGLPTVILEAMRLGVPVVSTSVASIGDVVIDNETGRLVPQKDVQALADAIRSLIEDRENALRMAAAARALVLDKFSEENTLGRMEELFTRAWKEDRIPH